MDNRNDRNAKHQVFIAYSYSDDISGKANPDRKAADRICEALEKNGIQCWIGHRDNQPGERWVDPMFNALEKSELVVLVVSSNFNEAKWVQDEITHALNNNIKIIPFMIEKVSPRGVLISVIARSQWINAHNPPTKENLEYLVKTVQANLEEIERKKLTVEAGESGERQVNNGIDMPDIKKRSKKIQWKEIILSMNVRITLLMLILIAVISFWGYIMITKSQEKKPLNQKASNQQQLHLIKADIIRLEIRMRQLERQNKKDFLSVAAKNTSKAYQDYREISNFRDILENTNQKK